MTSILKRQNLLVLLLTITLLSCKIYTSTTIYKSDSNKEYWTIQSLNVDNRKHTELYVTHYKNKKTDFRIFYTDSLIRKTIYASPKYSQRSNVKAYLATDKDDFLLSIDSVDQQIFSTIIKLNKTDSNIKYKLGDKKIKGYVLDPKYQ